MKWYLYILECNDKSLYTGITTDIKRRIREHNDKKGARSLMGKLPVKLVYKEKYQTQNEAAKREKCIKGWKKEYKLKLISRA